MYERLRLTRHITRHILRLCPTPGYFAGLPTELIEHILTFLDHDFTALSVTCTLLHHVCETRAEQLFRLSFGTNKPQHASWCRCLLVIARHFATKSIAEALFPGTILFYGLSQPRWLSALHIDWHANSPWSGLGIAHVYDALVKLNLWDTIHDLFIPYSILEITKRQGPIAAAQLTLLCATMAAQDERSFDAITALHLDNMHPLRAGFDDHCTLLSQFTETLLPDNPLLSRALHYYTPTPERIQSAVHVISRSCKTLADVQLLNFALTTLKGYVANEPTLSQFWSRHMFYMNNLLHDNDAVDAFIDVWRKYYPNLLFMDWGRERLFYGEARLDSFCNILVVHGQPGAALEFLTRHPDLRFDSVPPDAANKWWDLCKYLITTWCRTELVKVIFNTLCARGLPLSPKTASFFDAMFAVQ